MSKKKIKEFLIVLFGGLFGVHKLMAGNIKMGILYLFTGGLFGIGWIVDIIKVLTGRSISNSNSLMGREGIAAIHEGKLPNIQGTSLNLAPDEICCYMDKAYTFQDQTVITGYTGKSSGVSIRIAKGLSYRTGGSGGKAIRETQRTTYHGILYITTKRVIFTSTKDSFDKTFDQITSVQEAKDGVIIQMGSHTYSIITRTHAEFMKVFNLVKEAADN